jgi:hypothetical protein
VKFDIRDPYITLVGYFDFSYFTLRSRYRDGLRTGGPGFDFRQCKIFLLSTASGPTLGPTQPLISWVLGALSTRVKRPGRDADHSPPSGAEVKKGGAIPPPPYIFMA